MSESAIRTDIKTLLDSITGIGKVHDYERWTVNPVRFLELFKDTATNKVFGWEITRAGADIERITSKRFKVTHHFILKGYYGLRDEKASEKLFNAVIEAIISKIINNPIADTQGLAIPQINRIEARTFGQILCHYAEITLDISEILEELPEDGITDLIRVNLEYYLQDPEDDGVKDAEDMVDDLDQ